ncbi:MAG: hypothetical protein LBV80_00610 [Deltaproteobacteria bacterium]|jgi:hypothetical protein|nr:hypothetical protein [Deltaproteobacteria bacterium]
MSYAAIIDPALELSLDHDFGGIQGLSLKFLCAVSRGEVDVKELLEYELAARGYDDNGDWIGFSTRTNMVLARYAGKKGQAA